MNAKPSQVNHLGTRPTPIAKLRNARGAFIHHEYLPSYRVLASTTRLEGILSEDVVVDAINYITGFHYQRIDNIALKAI